MEIVEIYDKYSNNEGLWGQHGLVRDGKSKQNEIVRSPTAEELFEASSLFEADDEITELIERIAHSILFDDVLDELKATIPLPAEIEESLNADVNTLTDKGLTELQESNSAITRKQVDKPKGTESNGMSQLLQEMSREMTSKTYEALRVNISEVCQKRATEYSLNLLNEFLQDSCVDLSNDTCELLLYVVELFHKEVLEFGNELVESRLSLFDQGAQSFSYALVGELLNWYDDGFVQDVGELNTEFDEQMREFTEVAKQNLIPLCDDKIKRYGGLLGKAIEVRLQSAADLKASKERNTDADEIATQLNETENGFSGKETGVTLQVADDPQISKERKPNSETVAIELEEAGNGILGKETGVRLQKTNNPQANKERKTDSEDIDLDEAENGLLRKGTNMADIQACQEKADSDEASAELDNAENKIEVTSALELDILLPAMTEKKDKGKKKYSLKRLWRGVKKIFCCCVSVAERD